MKTKADDHDVLLAAPSTIGAGEEPTRIGNSHDINHEVLVDSTLTHVRLQLGLRAQHREGGSELGRRKPEPFLARDPFGINSLWNWRGQWVLREHNRHNPGCA